MIDEPLQFGTGGRLFGILTHPETPNSSEPVFVFLNAGLVHRVGPHRLHVLIARHLAAKGIRSLRVDLGGLGDSLPPEGIEYPESVLADFSEIFKFLATENGSAEIYLFGLCSGADNAIRLAANYEQISGMVLIDPVCEKDAGFDMRSKGFLARAFASRIASPSRYIPAVKRRIDTIIRRPEDDGVSRVPKNDPLSVRALPSTDLMRQAFERIGRQQGRILSVFTSFALQYYNECGQMGRALGLANYERFATELFWPHAEHEFPLEFHRSLLLGAIEQWVADSRSA